MESLSLRFLYRTPPGRAALKLLTRPGFSRFAGCFLDSRASRRLIPWAVRSWNVNLTEFEDADYPSFNAFFTRRRKKELLGINVEPERLISPCDGWLSAYPIEANSAFRIKGGEYSLRDLLDDAEWARRFCGGDCLIFRLTPSDYHRYCFIDDGRVIRSAAIPGVLHCVRPIACERYPVYVQNSREWTLIETERFGRVAQMEIGALMVGRIANEPLPPYSRVRRGQEKGRFEFGGSTIVLLFERDRIALDERVHENMRNGMETRVRTGAGIGRSRPIPAKPNDSVSSPD